VKSISYKKKQTLLIDSTASPWSRLKSDLSDITNIQVNKIA